MCQDIQMPGSWLNTIKLIKDGKAVTYRDEKANDGEDIPGAECLCQTSDRDILHMIVDKLKLEDEVAFRALMIMREYPGGTWHVEMTKFHEDEDDESE